MVTAGVYLVARFAPLYAHAPMAATTAQYLGLATAVMAAVVATVQTDIKRVLAYSTMSQVGYMLFAVSIGAEVAGIFHLVTHAFFKALLFLAAGNVIHALGGEQDMRKMGGLWRDLPLTGFLFLIGSLSLAGMVPLAGFFSKDEVISAGIAKGPGHPLGGLLLALAAGLTAYYTMRAFYMAFVGARGEGLGPAHEPARVMTLPVLILGFLAVVGGLIQPGPWHFLGDYTQRVFGDPSVLIDPGVVVLTLGLVLAGLVTAYQRFGVGRAEERAPAVLARAFYWDDLYRSLVVNPLWAAGSGLYRVVETPLVIGLADAGAFAAAAAGRQVRRLQTGYLRSYALLFAGAALMALALLGINPR
jgi:NADH-quinone oxidoreductase subunit L